MNAESPHLSLVICTYRRPDEVGRLLGSIEASAQAGHRVPAEILVVDASPEDGTERVVAELVERWQGSGTSKLPELPELRYDRAPPEHRGLTRQRNRGIDLTRGEIVAFLDDDTVPEPGYFARLLAAFEAHPDAVGVGGWITDEVAWRRVDETPETSSLGRFRIDGWERREDLRWRLRRLLGLGARAAPGHMPPAGHGRSVSFLPPTGLDYPVEHLMGGASAWRRSLFDRERFAADLAGYGLYEDLDFCLRAGRHGELWVATSARLAHLHAPGGRPHPARYGRMVVAHGWRVWRCRWPRPPLPARFRWWATTGLLALCRLGDSLRPGRSGAERRAALAEAGGRLAGALGTLVSPPPLPRPTAPAPASAPPSTPSP